MTRPNTKTKTKTKKHSAIHKRRKSQKTIKKAPRARTQRLKIELEERRRKTLNCHKTLVSFERHLAEKELKKDEKAEKEMIRLFKTPFTPLEYKPQNDYYTYINYEWISQRTKEIKKKLSKYYVQLDSFRITQEKVYYELNDIIKDYIKHNSGRKATSIKNLYTSLSNLNEDAVLRYIQFVKNQMSAFIAGGDLYEMLGVHNRNEVISWGLPIVWTVSKDEKDTTKYVSILSAPQLTLYDYELYIEDEKDDQDTKSYKKEFKRRYLDYINQIFDVCFGKGHEYKAQDVWDCEFEMLTALGCSGIKNDDLDGYNVMSGQQSLSQLGFDWERFTAAIGYKKTPNRFICSSKNYVKCMMETLTKDDAWKTPKWVGYIYYIIFRQAIRFHDEWKDIYYQFHGKFVRGQPAPFPKEIYPIFGMSLCFNAFLSDAYIERNYKPEHIAYVETLASDLLMVFKRIIRRNKWLSPSTKKYALMKLENIKLIIGSPMATQEDPLLDYSPTDAFQNLRMKARWRTQRMIELDGTKADLDIAFIDWDYFQLVGKQSYIVNAFYTPTENSIYVPLAYLQKPFIDLEERGIEYNLAHIGYTLGHEMSHSLDDMGSKYDYKGNLHNWWTKADRRKFNAKVRNVIKQYEQFAGYDGIKMDASLSTGENLADISGMAICEEYLRDFQDKNEDVVPIRALSFHAFFVYLAVQARQKIFDEAVKAQLKVNPHPMDKYRTNCPLARLELFKSLYNIKEGDKMWWPVSDTIW